MGGLRSLAVDFVFAQLWACSNVPVPTEARNDVLVHFSFTESQSSKGHVSTILSDLSIFANTSGADSQPSKNRALVEITLEH